MRSIRNNFGCSDRSIPPRGAKKFFVNLAQNIYKSGVALYSARRCFTCEWAGNQFAGNRDEVDGFDSISNEISMCIGDLFMMQIFHYLLLPLRNSLPSTMRLLNKYILNSLIISHEKYLQISYIL